MCQKHGHCLLAQYDLAGRIVLASPYDLFAFAQTSSVTLDQFSSVVSPVSVDFVWLDYKGFFWTQADSIPFANSPVLPSR